MPPAMAIERNELATLIRAATRWIDASVPEKRNTGLLQRLMEWLPGMPRKDGTRRV